MNEGAGGAMDFGAAASALQGWEGVPFEQIRAGDLVAERAFSITRDELRRFGACLGEDTVREDARVPAFLLNEITTAKSGLRFPPGVLHASEEIEMRRPVLAGEQLVAAVWVKETFVRNGKRFVVMEQAVRTRGTADPALRITRTLFWPC
jgi:hypothetical protein